MAHHVDRIVPLDPRVLINEIWYNNSFATSSGAKAVRKTNAKPAHLKDYGLSSWDRPRAGGQLICLNNTPVRRLGLYITIPAGSRDHATPYGVNSDLPPSVRSHLFERAQDQDLHMIVLAAVKRSCVKVGNMWVPREAAQIIR